MNGSDGFSTAWICRWRTPTRTQSFSIRHTAYPRIALTLCRLVPTGRYSQLKKNPATETHRWRHCFSVASSPYEVPDVNVDTADEYRGPRARWCFMGDGPLRAVCQSGARRPARIEFEDWLSYRYLPSRVTRNSLISVSSATRPKRLVWLRTKSVRSLRVPGQ